MKFSTKTVLCFSTILGRSLASSNRAAPAHSSTPLPFNFTYLFTATLKLGDPSNIRPILIPGGYLVNEPIMSDTVVGPSINATVQGGFAHPSVYGALQVPSIDLYGMTSDGQAFYIHETGTGSNAAQVTRLEININGTKYEQLNNRYILASVNPNANWTIVTVMGYLVENALA